MGGLEHRYCGDIGLFAIDRPREISCVWATEYCRRKCYNNRCERRHHKTIPPKDIRNESSWQAITGEALCDTLDRKRLATDRIRLMTRGEAFADASDIDRVAYLALENRDRWLWVPTRGWRDESMEWAIRRLIMPLQNVALLASTDPTTTPAEDRRLAELGWSTMFFGDDTAGATASGRPMFRCPKTFRGLKGHCRVCKAGCFARLTLGRRVDVHLRQH